MEENKGGIQLMNSFINHYTSDDDQDYVEEFDNFDQLGAKEYGF